MQNVLSPHSFMLVHFFAAVAYIYKLCDETRGSAFINYHISFSVFISRNKSNFDLSSSAYIPTLPANTYIYYTGWSAPIWGLPLFLSTCSEYIELLWSYLRVQETNLLCKVEKTQSEISEEPEESAFSVPCLPVCMLVCLYLARGIAGR